MIGLRSTSQAGHYCAFSRIGARRSQASTSTTPVGGSYRRHSWRWSKPCVSSQLRSSGEGCGKVLGRFGPKQRKRSQNDTDGRPEQPPIVSWFAKECDLSQKLS